VIKVKISNLLKKEIEEKANIIAKNKLNKIVSDLKEATPVDTGFARDHWKLDKNSISNTTEYIQYLNQGTSKQAPEYFIEKTLLAQPGVRPSGTIVRLL